jgi:hypothetical protein
MAVWLPILMQLLPSLISLAEKLLGPKTGEAKKELVLEAAGIAMNAVGAFSTGGQAQTWERIKPMVSTIVDAGAAIAFPKPHPAGGAFGDN